MGEGLFLCLSADYNPLCWFCSLPFRLTLSRTPKTRGPVQSNPMASLHSQQLFRSSKMQ